MMRSRRWSVLVAGLLFLALLAANMYVFLTREWESSFSPTSYATLYYPLDAPTIRAWRLLERDRLQLHLACGAPVERWSVYTNGGHPQFAEGTDPSFRIDTTFSQLTTYRLVPYPEGITQTVEITIRYYPREFYASQGMDRGDVYIVHTNVPCGEFKQFAVEDWVDDYAYVGAEGLAAADKIIKEDMGITPADPTFTRMEKLTRYLKGKLANSGGVPKDDERWMNAWALYKEMASGTGKGWCTQNAQVWVFWANRAGIPTRFVFGARTEDNTIVYTGHSFSESYVREQHRWAFTDFMHGNIYVTDKAGQVLNAAELFQLNQHDAFDSCFARIHVDKEWEQLPGVQLDTVVTVPYRLTNAVIRDDFTAHSILKYRRPPNVEDVREIYTGFIKDWTFLTGNVERYLFKPQLAYSFYPTEGATTYAIRQVLFFTMVATFLTWVLLMVLPRRRKAVK